MKPDVFTVVIVAYLAIGVMCVAWNYYTSVGGALLKQQAEERGKLGWVFFGLFLSSLIWPIGILIRLLGSQKK